MKKRGLILLILALFIAGCVPSYTETTTTTTPKPAEEQVIAMCVQLLEAETAGDEKKFMSLIPKDSPDYDYILQTSQTREKLDYVIHNYGCRLQYLDGDTARVEVTYDYELNEEPNVMSVVWTFKNKNNRWVYWHGSR